MTYLELIQYGKWKNDWYTHKQTIVTKLTVKSAKERQFGSTTTSWHWIKQAAGFLSLDLKYPHKTKGMHHQISHCKVGFKVHKMMAELLWREKEDVKIAQIQV